MSKYNKAILEMLNGNKTDIPEAIKNVPTLSSHELTVRRIINDVLTENKDYKYAIWGLVSYPIQEWAIAYRKKLKFDSESLIKLVSFYQEDVYFGFQCANLLDNQIKNMDSAERYIKYTRNILANEDQEILKKIHGGKKTTISKYFINKSYKGSLINFCKLTNEDYKKMFEEVAHEKNYLDFDIRMVYHDTKMLIDLYSEVIQNGLPYGHDVNLHKAVSTIQTCISAIGKCPISNSDKMQFIVKESAKGKKQMVIAESLNKSQYFVSTMYQEGIKVLSVLIWGISTQDVYALLS
jgi:hypothetical protein